MFPTPAPASPEPETTRLERMLQPAMVGVGVVAGLTYLLHADPNQPGHYPTCPSVTLTGLYCPGCGSLRCTWDLMHGDVAGAFARNPVVPFVILYLVWVYAAWVWRAWRGVPAVYHGRPWHLWALGIGVVGFTIARNVPGWTWLSPA